MDVAQWQRAIEVVTEVELSSLAPYKIVRRNGKWAVVNNANMTKATFDTHAEARKYQKALYANVKGAAKKADKTPWTGKEPKPKDAA